MEMSSWNVGVGLLSAVLVLSYTYTKLAHVDSYYLTFSYTDCITRSQWWRILTSSICYSSVLQFILTVVTLLSLYPVEHVVGTSYFLKYTLLLVFAEKFIFLASLFIFTKRLRPGLYDWLLTIPHCSITGVLFAWITYQSLTSSESIILLYFSVPSYLSLLFHCSLFNAVLLQNSEPVSQFSGILAGVALRLGLLEILPSTYWLLCFLFNASLAIMWSLAINSGEDMDDSSHDMAEDGVLNIV